MSKALYKRIGLAGAAVTLLALPAVAASPAGADTFTVTTTIDGGAGSLRQAVDDVNAAGGTNTIVLASGATYVLDICDNEGDEDDNTNGDLDFTDDAGVVTIQGNGSTIQQTCPDERVIDYFAYEDDGITLENVTLTGGREDDYGGGIHVDGGLTLTGVTITDNTADEYGGGIAADDGYDVTITNSVITNNETDEWGGGIEADYTTFTMTGSTVAGNEATFEGGGLYLELVGEGTNGAIISHSTVSGNNSGDGGGGVYFVGDALLVDNSTFTGNSTTDSGGAIDSDDDLRLTYVTIASNTAPFASNVTTGGELTSFGTVIADPLGGGENCSLEVGTSLGYNYEADGDTCDFNEPTDVADGADPELGALAANGGLTQTMLPADSSPLVDAIPTDDPDCRSDDQRGIVRPQFEGCDIGAVELAPAPPPTTTATTTTTPAAAAVVVPRFTG